MLASLGWPTDKSFAVETAIFVVKRSHRIVISAVHVR